MIFFNNKFRICITVNLNNHRASLRSCLKIGSRISNIIALTFPKLEIADNFLHPAELWKSLSIVVKKLLFLLYQNKPVQEETFICFRCFKPNTECVHYIIHFYIAHVLLFYSFLLV